MRFFYKTLVYSNDCNHFYQKIARKEHGMNDIFNCNQKRDEKTEKSLNFSIDYGKKCYFRGDEFLARYD